MTTADAANFNEEEFGASFSGYPMNHITAGDIDSGKMIEGLNPETATLEECQAALYILYANKVLKRTHSCPMLRMMLNPEDNKISLYYSREDIEQQTDGNIEQQEASYNFGLLAAHTPKKNYKYATGREEIGQRPAREQCLIVDNLSTLAATINGLAKVNRGEKVLDQITAIQAEKGAALT